MNSIQLIPLQKPVTQTISIPGSKSYTNRALLMAVLTKGSVTITNPLFSDDTKAMIDCLKALGVKLHISSNAIAVDGSYEDVVADNYHLDTNLAATAIRFLLPLLCIIPGTKTLTGKPGLNKRPIKDLVEALQKLGAVIEYTEKEGFPPLRINSSQLQSQSLTIDGNISSQFLSALFMIAPVIGGLTINVEGVQISKPYIDMTIASMKEFGVDVTNEKYEKYTISDSQTYHAKAYQVEGDFSSAGYFFAIAALTKSTLTLKNLAIDSLQADKKILSVLEEMGALITHEQNSITVKGNGATPISLDMIDFPDQAQTLAVVAAFADGKTVLSGLQSLHVKETDRLLATITELEKMGIKTDATYDTLTIYGGSPVRATIDTYDDQRTAMSFAVAGAQLEGMIINNPEVVSKTFPDFWKKLAEIGVQTKENI